MKTKALFRSIPIAILAATMSPISADESHGEAAPPAAAASRPLKIDGAEIKQVRHYLHGLGDTQIFIQIPEQHAVVKIFLPQSNREFPATGQVILFAPGTHAEGIAGWINNQHSCGLFPDVPKPIFTGQLPDGSVTVVEKEKTGEAVGPMDQATYEDYKVKVAVKAHAVPGKYTLEAFELESNVYLKVITL